jgi:hypothetical protein
VINAFLRTIKSRPSYFWDAEFHRCLGPTSQKDFSQKVYRDLKQAPYIESCMVDRSRMTMSQGQSHCSLQYLQPDLLCSGTAKFPRLDQLPRLLLLITFTKTLTPRQRKVAVHLPASSITSNHTRSSTGTAPAEEAVLIILDSQIYTAIGAARSGKCAAYLELSIWQFTV